MAEVFDIKQEPKEIKKTIKKESPTSETFIQRLLKEIYKDSNNLNDLLVFTKDLDGEITLFHTGIDVRDKSYIIQLLQHDVMCDIGPTEDLDFEEDS